MLLLIVLPKHDTTWYGAKAGELVRRLIHHIKREAISCGHYAVCVWDDSVLDEHDLMKEHLLTCSIDDDYVSGVMTQYDQRNIVWVLFDDLVYPLEDLLPRFAGSRVAIVGGLDDGGRLALATGNSEHGNGVAKNLRELLDKHDVECTIMDWNSWEQEVLLADARWNWWGVDS